MSDQLKNALLDALNSPMPARVTTPPPETVRPDVTLTACGCDNLRDSLRAQLGGRTPTVCAEHRPTTTAAPAVALNDDAALAALALGNAPTKES